MTVDAPYSRIVPQDIVEAVLERKSNAGRKHARRAPRSKRLLSGLLRCGACGGMPILGSDRRGSRIQCSTYKENGSCKKIADLNNSARHRRFAEALSIASQTASIASLSFALLRIKAFRENPESLTEILSSKDVEIAPDLTQVFRELIAAVVVKAGAAGEGYIFELKGPLSAFWGMNAGQPEGRLI